MSVSKIRNPASGHVRWWVGVGAWAIADQLLGALANFTLNVLLARWLDPSAYGVFAAAYALIWLFWCFYQGLLLDPAMVFSSTRFREHLPVYHSSIVVGHGALSIGFIVVLLVADMVSHIVMPARAGLPWFSLALAGPFIFLQVLLRGLCRARLQTALGAAAALFYAMTMWAGLLACYRLRLLSGPAAFAVMAAAGAASSAWLVRRLRLDFRGLLTPRHPLVSRIAAEHWRYGRWLVGLSLLSWIPLNIWYMALPSLAGSGDAASLRALVNLSQPAIQGHNAIQGILIPMFVQANENRRFRPTLKLMLGASFAASVAFAVLVDVAARPVIEWLYGGRYIAQVPLLAPLLLTMVVMNLSVVQSAAMQAVEHADWLMASYVAAALVALCIGLPATALWGLRGAVAGQFCSVSALAIAQAWWLWRRLPR